MPAPVKKRVAARNPSEGDTALASEAMPNSVTLIISSGLRPKRSPIGPASRAPAMMPMLDHRKASANAGGAMCQAWVSDGTDQPIEPTS